MIKLASGEGVLYGSANGQELIPLCELTDIELSCTKEDGNIKSYFSSKEITLTCNSSISISPGLRYFFLTGKELFLKCPKKIRRSRKWKQYCK